MNASINSNFLPHDRIIYLDSNQCGMIGLSQKNKSRSSFSFFAQNKARSALSAILQGLSEDKEFQFENKFGTKKISDVAHVIFERYKTRYKASYWQWIVDIFKRCFGVKTDLQKMEALLNSILGHHKVKVGAKSSKKMTDPEIIQNLVLQNYSRPIEKGGDGRCLFLSVASQITKKDLVQAFLLEHLDGICGFAQWSELSLGEQADHLRKWAMQEENHFFTNLPSTVQELNEDDLNWIREFYKDMLQELKGLGTSNSGQMKLLHEMITESSDEQKYECCKNNFEEYSQNTSRQFNWAGTSELIALSRIFNRATMAFGQDYASSNEVKLDENNNVLPYHHRPLGSTPAIVVFQCNGGGHYKMLK